MENGSQSRCIKRSRYFAGDIVGIAELIVFLQCLSNKGILDVNPTVEVRVNCFAESVGRHFAFILGFKCRSFGDGNVSCLQAVRPEIYGIPLVGYTDTVTICEAAGKEYAEVVVRVADNAVAYLNHIRVGLESIVIRSLLDVGVSSRCGIVLTGYDDFCAAVFCRSFRGFGRFFRLLG